MDLTVYVSPEANDVSDARDGIEELAFDAVMGVANILGIEIASDEFNSLYLELVEAYKETADYLLYFMHMGLLAVKLQLENGTFAVPVGVFNPLDLRKRLIDAAKPIAACLLHVVSTKNRLAVSDEDLAALPADVLEVDFHLVGAPTKGNNEEHS
jgi:hypothetical protein